MEAIIISGMPASGKTTVANIISKELKIPTIGGGDILKEMAVERGYNPGGNDWWDTSEGMEFLKERNTNPDFDKETDVRMKEKIAKGSIVVTSWTAPWLSKKGFKVWLNATAENRAQRMSMRDRKDIAKMTEIVKKRDEENYILYKKLYKIEFGKDMKPFDMIIDTDKRTPEQVAKIVLEKYRERNPKYG